MATERALRGYLLEEVLAWLLRNSGYSLLTEGDKDESELIQRGSTLEVRGRGAEHQVDVLGQFPFTPAFSLPIRLFLEAKFYDKSRPCGLTVVRNAHGVINDVNQNFVPGGGRQPRRRYQYSYALFSTSGFTEPAQRFAIAHQISLVDLSGDSFTWLRDLVHRMAAQLCAAAPQGQVPGRVVNWIRTSLRDRLNIPRELQDGLDHELAERGLPHRFSRGVLPALDEFVSDLADHEEAELLIGFPAAPFILPLNATNRQQFLAYASQKPLHPIRIRRTGEDGSAEWTITPRDPDTKGYRLTFALPKHVEDWISLAGEDERQRRSEAVKADFLSSITIYRMKDSALSVYQLSYEPAELRRRYR